MDAELSHRIARRIATANLVVAVVLAVYFLIVPGFLVVRNVADPAMREPGIPRMAWRLHRDLTPRLRIWAERRMASGDAGRLQLHDVPSTEWPIFSCVFYLWATESLQDAWPHHPVGAAPRDYARKTVDAAVNLVLDPVHHTWVKTHWGPNYMHRENVFFRSLVIAALTSHYRLTGETAHLGVLKDQLDTLSAELDASPHGVLNDYPDECYPIDVLAAVAWIHRADEVVGTDHSSFVARAVRGFEGAMLDARGLIPYCADPNTGRNTRLPAGWGIRMCPSMPPRYGRIAPAHGMPRTRSTSGRSVFSVPGFANSQRACPAMIGPMMLTRDRSLPDSARRRTRSVSRRPV